ncbi:MAG: hypothetical protein HYR96_07090 [Deltaproteobacteria bacterium]|nr:hypothetical protein [Deltaproteobacteria bacterium]MBI3294918.1 hypothetical protein [Deltaproteobacteria bacterium]
MKILLDTCTGRRRTGGAFQNGNHNFRKKGAALESRGEKLSDIHKPRR